MEKELETNFQQNRFIILFQRSKVFNEKYTMSLKSFSYFFVIFLFFLSMTSRMASSGKKRDNEIGVGSIHQLNIYL